MLLAIALALIGCTSGEEQSSTAATETSTTPTSSADTFALIPEIIESVESSVVTVVVPRVGEGSGVVWDGKGHIVTNEHVVTGAREIEVTLADGTRLAATYIAGDPRTDLAVLRVERAGLPAAEFRESLPRVGELALALGNPLGFENTATAGIVSGLHRSIPSGGLTPALVDLLQTDAPISPGNSGGALVGRDGTVIGINVAYLPPQTQAVSLGFAIASPTVIDVVRQLLVTGQVEHAYLGVDLRPVTPDLAEQLGFGAEEGALVFGVAPGSAAARAGIRPGDIVVEFDGDPVRTVEDLLVGLRRHSPGDEVRAKVQRGKDRLEFVVRLAGRPET
jgi:S1-C subfamily serine protease